MSNTEAAGPLDSPGEDDRLVLSAPRQGPTWSGVFLFAAFVGLLVLAGTFP